MSFIKNFLKLEAASGILLILATVLAMIAVNSPLSTWYNAFIETPVVVQFGKLSIAKPLLLWINDGLMAVFFFLIGLEIKREVLTGELSKPSQLILPCIAAVGGMSVPAIIYSIVNAGDAVAMRGWAIPAATDIAFALGILALLGSRVPTSLKIFLATLAIADDLGAIVIIAIFYTSDLSVTSLYVASAAIIGMFAVSRAKVISITPYLLLGIVLWVAVLKSGVHATLAGVITALFIPHKYIGDYAKYTQLERMEHDLHPVVNFLIIPMFAFANAGIPLSALSLEYLTHPVTVGIAAGLFIGNQVGVFAFSWAVIKLGWAERPRGASWAQIYGIAMLCGIGFTMSLFIGSLAFGTSALSGGVDERTGIMLGSFLSALGGYLILRFAKQTS